ncbi:8004_t:CDS:2 [Acaulospora morrowiae]|uniref:8004_t:CDS:1 n=1 Tax=Acaulospora morrowiae TaxID=94023 RepID=A0A9N9FYK7_9GLOM|nr:8004_t:CDS:2 [Acaulospora morrowiae]
MLLGVSTLYDLVIVKTNKEKPLSSDQIGNNIIELQRKLKRDTTLLYQHLYSGVKAISIEALSWKDPMASQVISDESKLVKELPENFKKEFMKESKEDIKCVVKEILNVLKDIWNNSAFDPKLQSIASSNRMEEGYMERHPDIMLTDNEIKLWQETNGELYWIRQSLKLDKNQFGIVGMQVADNVLHLNFLVRNMVNVHQYYHLQSAEIPVQFLDEAVVTKFIETLLLLHNIIITNLSLLYNAPTVTSQRQMEDSTTVSTSRDDN